MNKSIFVMPCIYVYKLIAFIISLVIGFIRYASIGFFFVGYHILYFIITILFESIKYVFYGIMFSSIIVYKLLKSLIKYDIECIKVVVLLLYHFIKYVIYGVIFPFALIINVIKKISSINAEEREARRLVKEEEYRIKQLEKAKLIQEKEIAKEKEFLQKQEEIAEKKRKKEKDSEDYINENVKIEKKTIGDRINDGLTAIVGAPKNLFAKIKESIMNSSLIKNARNKKDINRQALLINFDSEDAVKSTEKQVYEYVGKNPEGKVIKGYMYAFSKVEVHSFLLSVGFEVYSIKTNKWISLLHGNVGGSAGKIRTKDLIFFLTQLSTYIKAGIPLVEALGILSRQFKQKSYQRIFKAMIYDLTMGENFSTAMSKQGKAFPKLLVNMVKTSEMTGELPEALDDMEKYYSEAEATKKQMVTALTYPLIILVLAVAVVIFIMVYVVPKFVDIYSSMDNAKIPGITIFVLNLSHFLQKNLIWILVGIVVGIILLRYLYKNVKLIKTFIQWILMHLPVFSNVIIYNEVTMFTKTFSSLLKHNVFITDSMDILNKITDNEIYKMMILDTITNLAKGEKISAAFKDQWAFPVPAYEMIVTGERTGQLAEMMQKVSDYYQELHKNAVGRIKAFIEPALIIGLTGIVGVIVLSIVIPMFGMYTEMGM